MADPLEMALDAIVDTPETIADTQAAPSYRMPAARTFDTPLSSTDEAAFQQWKATHAPHDSGADYDLRGAFKAGLRPDAATGHWPDTYKKPNHPTFSDQSIYSSLTGTRPGTWEGDQYRPMAGGPDPLDSSLDAYTNQEDADKLRGTTAIGVKTPTSKATRVLQLTGQTGLPHDFIERNLDYVEQETAKQTLNPTLLIKQSPAFASWLAEHPDHVAAAAPDAPALTFIEKQLRNIPAQYEQGKRTVEYGEVMLGVVQGLLDKTDVTDLRKRQAALEAEMAKPDETGLSEMTGISGVVQRAPGWMAQQLPILGSTLEEQVKTGAKGVVVGAIGGGAAGGLPGAAVGGATVGAAAWRLGAAINSAKMEFAQAFGEYEKLKDAEGLPLDQETAMGLAGIVGVVNGSIDGFFGIEGLTSKLPGINQFSRQGIKELLSTPTTSRALLSYARVVGQTMAVEGVTEALQMYITKAGGVALEAVKNGGSPADWLGKIFSEENLRQAATEAEAGAMGGGGISTVLAAPKLAGDIAEVRRANQSKQAFEAIGKATAETKFHVELPAHLRDIVDRATKDGPIETLYVPEHAFREYFQKEGVDPRAVYGEITGDVEAYDQAVTTGADLPIQTADYVQKLAGTKHNKFFAHEMRTSVDAMNGYEADEWVKEQDALDKETQAGVKAETVTDSAGQVRVDIAGQLLGLGFDPTVVDQYAALFESRYRARAERRGLGETAADLFRQQNLSVTRPVPEVLQRLGQTTELDALLNQLRAGEAPTQTEVFGQSLTEFLREQGGVQDIGGELTARNIDRERKPFQKGFIKEAGKTLDEAAQAAVEAGYLQERDIAGLLNALDQEARGTPVFAVGKEQAAAYDLQQNLESLRTYLEQRGVDLATATNPQIKAMLGEAVQQPLPGVEGETFAQTKPTVPTFFSKLEQVVAEKMGPKMPATDLRKMLVANGVKEEELKWTGLDEYLKDKATVTKEEVSQFLSTHLVTITPIMLGEPTGMTEEQFYEKYKRQIAQLKEMGWDVSVLAEEDDTIDRIAFLEVNNADAELAHWSDLPNEQPGGVGKPARLTDAQIKRALGEQTIIPLNAQGLAGTRSSLDIIGLTYDQFEGTTATRVYGFQLPNNGGTAYFWLQEGQYIIPIAGAEENADTIQEARRILYEEFVAPEILNVQPSQYGTSDSPQEIAHFLTNEVENPPAQSGSSAPKFASWQMKPGDGVNYREVLLTLPPPIPSLPPGYHVEPVTGGKYKFTLVFPDGTGHAMPSSQTIEEATQAAVEYLQRVDLIPKGAQFTAGHYPQPNVLAHVRINDRTDSEGRKVMFVEEIQSDWHQKARDVRKAEVKRLAEEAGVNKGDLAFKDIESSVPVDFGYQKKWTPEQVAKFRVLSPVAAATEGQQFDTQVYVVLDGDGNILATPPKHLNDTAQAALDVVKKAALSGELHGIGKFPPAPFMKTEQWAGLALKWLLRHAAEGNYDVMAWTPGAVQNTRYSLSQQIDQIRYEKNEDGTFHLWVKPIGSSETDQIRNTDLRAVPVGQLADIVGKDVAEKIVGGFSSVTQPVKVVSVEEMQEATGHTLIIGLPEMTRLGFRESPAGIKWKDGSVSGFASKAQAVHELARQYALDMGTAAPEHPSHVTLAEMERVTGVHLRRADPLGRNPEGSILVRPNGAQLTYNTEVEAAEALRTIYQEITGTRPVLKVKSDKAQNVITGLDLDVAGGGMKSFYDKLVPNVLKDIGKKWGAKVETVNLGPKAGAAQLALTNPTRPVFYEVAPGEQGIDGLEGWPNGDEPVMAETQIRVGLHRYDVEVYLDTNGVHIMGADENSEPFEYAATKEMGSFRHIRWDTAAEAKRAATSMWGTTEASFFWETMTPIHGLDNVTPTERDDVGPVTDWTMVERGEAPPAKEVQGVPITEQMKEAVTVRGQPLFQAGEKPKGSITFGNQQISIKLLEKADLSTFIHETGHLYLNELLQDAQAVAAVPAESRTPIQTQLLEDMATIQKWLGNTEGAATITTDQHEQFARGFEAYTMEGKSPSQAMREVFATFRRWLIQAYRSLTTAPLNVKLTRDVRAVMDRMIATDEEIDRAADEQQVHPLFTDAESAGMTPTQFAAYRDTVAKASLLARETLQKQLMAQYQREHAEWWKERRAEKVAAITADVNDQNVYVALSVLQTGKLPDGSDLPEGVAPMKLDRKAIRQQMGQAFLASMPKGTTKHKGMHQDTAAPLFGYNSGQALLLALVNARPKNAVIQAEADQQMRAEYGDLLTDGTIAEAARAAVLNEEQGKVIAAEIRALNQKRREVAPFVKAAKAEEKAAQVVGQETLRTMIPTLEDTRELARKILGRTAVKNLDPYQYSVAARQASREATKALAKDEFVDAGHFKQRELLNLALFREALIIKEQMRKANELFKSLFKADATLAKGYNVDLVNVGRAILAQYGLGRPTEKTAAEYLEPIKTYDQDLYRQWKPQVDALAPRQLDYRAMTVQEFTKLYEDIQALWLLARRTKQMKINDQLVDRQQVVDELTAAMSSFTKAQQAQVVGAQTPWADTTMGLLSWGSALKRVESWVRKMDGGDINGIFRRYIWTPISEASDTFREAKKNLLKQYLQLIQPIENTLTRDLIPAPELGPDVSFRGKTALLHAVLHTGNDSNQSKLLRGYHWDPASWQRFLDRMYRERTLTKLDYDFAQGVWDLLDSIKPQAQQAHHEMYGYYFSEITARPVVTPFGTYKGGYVPAIADRVQSVDQAIREEKDLFDQAGNSFMFPTTGRGFTKARVEEYAAPLALDMTSIPVHLDKTMRFVHLEPRIKDAARLVTNKQFRQALDAMNSTVAKDMLVPWLQRSAQQTVSTPGKNRHADRLFRYLRKSVGAQIMVGNVLNTLQQFSGFPIAATMVKPRYLRGSMMAYLRHPITYGEEIANKSTFMRGRTATQVIEIQQTIDDILLNPTKYDEVRKFLERHGYFMQQGTQNLVDLITWGGAYDQATAQDLDERMAVRAADSAVRLTQGSFAPETLSAFEAGTPFTRAFTMFYSYFNMQANLLTTEMQIVAHEMGLRKGAGRAIWVYTMGFLIPAVLSESIIRGLGGFDPDDDDDYLNEALSLFFGSQLRTALAMIPGVGPITLAGIGAFTSKQYDDRISTSPIVTVLEAAVRAPHSVYMAMSEDGHTKRAVRDVLTFLGLVTGLPLGALGRPLGYLADVTDGVAQPENAGDVARGLLSGKDVNRTK